MRRRVRPSASAIIAAGTNRFAAGVGMLAGVSFVVRERRASDPMLPPRLFGDRQFTGANLSTFAVYAALAGFSLFLVLQLQDVLGYDATAAVAGFMTNANKIASASFTARYGRPAQKK